MLRALGYNHGFDFSEGTYRDALYRGDCDDGVGKLCELLGWQDELKALVESGAAQAAL